MAGWNPPAPNPKDDDFFDKLGDVASGFQLDAMAEYCEKIIAILTGPLVEPLEPQDKDNMSQRALGVLMVLDCIRKEKSDIEKRLGMIP